MRVVVTGAAGFIGSTLADALLAGGHDVLGVDCFTPYYDEATKRANLPRHDRFEHVDADLRTAELAPLLEGADVVYHQAAQPGVRLSWSTGFADYDSHNVLATQRLLEAAVAVRMPAASCTRRAARSTAGRRRTRRPRTSCRPRTRPTA